MKFTFKAHLYNLFLNFVWVPDCWKIWTILSIFRNWCSPFPPLLNNVCLFYFILPQCGNNLLKNKDLYINIKMSWINKLKESKLHTMSCLLSIFDTRSLTFEESLAHMCWRLPLACIKYYQRWCSYIETPLWP